MPAFLASDEEDSEDEGRLLGARRVRRNYDEPMGDDEDAYGGVRFPFSDLRVSLSWAPLTCGAFFLSSEQEMPLEQLSDIRADSIAQWIEDPRAKRTIMREFKSFLMTYTDVAGVSIYGQRIRQLGESTSLCPFPILKAFN